MFGGASLANPAYTPMKTIKKLSPLLSLAITTAATLLGGSSVQAKVELQPVVVAAMPRLGNMLP